MYARTNPCRVCHSMGFICCRLCGTVRRNVYTELKRHLQISHSMGVGEYLGRFAEAAVEQDEADREITRFDS